MRFKLDAGNQPQGRCGILMEGGALGAAAGGRRARPSTLVCCPKLVRGLSAQPLG